MLFFGGMRVPDAELTITATKASGPGGQNVNKVATAAELRWNLWRSSAFSDADKHRLVSYRPLAARLTAAGDVLIKIKQERTLPNNMRLARKVLDRLVEDALRPRAIRLTAIPTHVANRLSRTRRSQKEHQRAKKSARRPPDDRA